MEKKAEVTSPLWSRLRTPVMAATGLGSLGGFVWLGLTGFPLIGLVPLVAMVIVAAVLFSPCDEPSKRLERLIKALRRDR
jgi:hypothetical protein